MDYFFTTVCPSLGVVISSIQLASPFVAVLACRRSSDLGPLNPVPLAVSFVNLFGWAIYATCLNDLYLMLSVFLGVGLNYLGCTTALSLLAMQGRMKEVRRMEHLLLGGVYWWMFLGLSRITYLPNEDILLTLMGVTTCSTTVLYFFSPLTTIRHIIVMKDASSLYLPMLIMNLIASTLWSTYGFFGARNVWVYLPNTLGLLITLAQIAVKSYYPTTAFAILLNDHEKMALADTQAMNASSSSASSSSASRVEMINATMGMGLGGVGGIGGVGLPGLVGMQLQQSSQQEDPLGTSTGSGSASLTGAEDRGMAIGEGFAEFMPAVAAGVADTLMEMRDIVMSPFVSGPVAALDTSARSVRSARLGTDNPPQDML